MISNKRILIGFYQGLGDFVSAVPVMNQLLKQGNQLYIAASAPCQQLFELCRIRGEEVTLLDYRLFGSMSWCERWRFVSTLRKIKPDYMFVSPHADTEQASWKIPLLLRWLKLIGWNQTTVIGADSERNAQWLDQAVAIDRTLKLIEREWALYTTAKSIDHDSQPDLDIFDKEHLNSVEIDGCHLVIHPGASRENKQWPVEHWANLAKILPQEIQITFIGLDQELMPIRKIVTESERVHFFVGPIVEAVKLIASASICITMDSGFSHIVARLGVRHIALFGSTAPERYGPGSDGVWLTNQPPFDCQPCYLKICLWSDIRCMSGISPETVAEQVKRMITHERSKLTE